MRVHLAVLFAVTAVCPAATQTCATPEVLTYESFPPITPAAAAGEAVTPFCAGWEAGWSRGWKDVKGGHSPPPPTPSCPASECGRIGYDDGYQRGRAAGTDRASGRNGP
jgi:hypothetical protein